ncbi:LysR family transcriptional regulator [Phreatobacter aquaticus]|uniref:LysR family transcriptional regulator n=1 Tax=Phreatobacter aquaticus TaxID=2570229 RepID=A0A4D7QVL4_9HYPH|nr:LysR substrate-binding domain-containing protein [Phreatobacter aquaticus]QCK88012.1 LysR family transcriptional regulator [Phreatobacter aquaticus]
MPSPLPPFDFDLLRSFVAIVDNGGFTRAAERIGRTQSTISLQIRKLEQGLGRPVFTRQGMGRSSQIGLTRDGEVLLGHARQILRLGDEARSRIMEPEVEGIVRLGTPEDFATWHLPDILARFARSHPRVLLEVNCDFTVNLLDGFGKGLYDLVLFKREPQRTDGLAGTGVWREELVWVADQRLELPASGEALPLVLAPAPDIYRRRALAALEAAGRTWRVVFASPSMAGLQAAVRAGLGITVMPREMVPANLVVLGAADDGLPVLPDAEIVLYEAPGKAAPAVARLAGHIVQALGSQAGRRV